jgi:Arc/MetJ-type ribon-helix-helix transcriptional regulator
MARTTSRATRKATFNLRPETLNELDRAVAEGAAPSKNAFVERALRQALDTRAREARKARWEAGARDPLLLKDLAEADLAFYDVDAETARRIG